MFKERLLITWNIIKLGIRAFVVTLLVVGIGVGGPIFLYYLFDPTGKYIGVAFLWLMKLMFGVGILCILFLVYQFTKWLFIEPFTRDRG